jgi:hypothetical protein
VIPFIIGIHRGVALATSDRRAAFDHIILFHLVYKGVIGAVEIGNIFTGFEIKTGKHMKHGSNLSDIRQREYKGDWVTRSGNNSVMVKYQVGNITGIIDNPAVALHSLN